MQLHTLEKVQEVSVPLETVFRFFERPENLERITPDTLGFRILTPPPAPMHVGSIIDYTVKVRGLPMRWTTAIAEYAPPHRFVDVQLRGPYSFWHHAHEFHATKTGTRIVDVITYALPFGVLGGLAHALFVRRDIDAIFVHRAAVIEELLSDAVRGEAAAHRNGGVTSSVRLIY
jgi:ligand-binding SRPBCC domain-containing protein